MDKLKIEYVDINSIKPYKKNPRKVERICKNCGANFLVYKSLLNKSNSSGNFCCRKCYNIYQKTLTGDKNNNYSRVKKKCQNCGKDIEVTLSKTKYYKNNFCSKKCKYEYHHNYIEGEKNCNWLGGNKNYRGNFETIKKQYFNDKNKFCALCGSKENIHIHHIVPYRFTNDNKINNLIPLCNKHHKMIESLTINVINTGVDLKVFKLIMNNILRTYQIAHIGKVI